MEMSLPPAPQAKSPARQFPTLRFAARGAITRAGCFAASLRLAG